jgi:hypothetical protein
MFNGGTLLLAGTYAPAGKIPAQGLNLLLVYGANVAASRSAGALMASFDWRVINLAYEPLLLAAVMALRSRAGAERDPTGARCGRTALRVALSHDGFDVDARRVIIPLVSVTGLFETPGSSSAALTTMAGDKR